MTSTGPVVCLVDACVLVGVFRRGFILALAELSLVVPRWSSPILDEMERALIKVLRARGDAGASQTAWAVRQGMVRAHPDALVQDFEDRVASFRRLPDRGDAHVLAAALQAGVPLIVTDNLRHFPARLLEPLGLRALGADAFIAETIARDPRAGDAALHALRTQLGRSDEDVEALFGEMRRARLRRTVLALRRSATTRPSISANLCE